jgi:hypothetical protein
MREDKLNTQGGEELPVFYLGSKPNSPNKSEEEASCCPKGHDGAIGETGKLAWEAGEVDPATLLPEVKELPLCAPPMHYETKDVVKGVSSLEHIMKAAKPHHPLCPAHTLPESAKEEFISKIMGKIKGWTTPAAKTAVIDDSLDSDVVNEPVCGRIYKVKGLNIIAKYKKTSEVGLHLMSFHGDGFLVIKEDGMLLRATPLEVERYLGKVL